MFGYVEKGKKETNKTSKWSINFLVCKRNSGSCDRPAAPVANIRVSIQSFRTFETLDIKAICLGKLKRLNCPEESIELKKHFWNVQVKGDSRNQDPKFAISLLKKSPYTVKNRKILLIVQNSVKLLFFHLSLIRPRKISNWFHFPFSYLYIYAWQHMSRDWMKVW